MNNEKSSLEKTLAALEKLLTLTVGDVMHRNVITLTVDDLLATAARTMIENRVNGIVILKEDKPFAVLSSWDLLHLSYLESFSEKMDYLKTPLGKLIENPVLYFLSPVNRLVDAARLIAEKHIRTVPIVENGQLVGVISTYDLVNIYNNAVLFENLK